MNSNIQGPSRLLRTAQELKAYFEKKLKNAPMQEEQQASVREALAGLISSAGDLETRREGQQRLEQQMSTIQEELPSNVISIRRSQEQKTAVYSSVNDKRWILRLDCLIESAYVSEIHKMAMELHSQSRRYAFVEIRDLDKATRQSLPDLLALGAISLFVPSILDISRAEQETLRRLMEIESLQRPLLMVGSALTFSELRGESGVNLDFLSQLSRAYIKLTKPFSEYKEQGLIHYFLDSLSESPS